MMATNPFKNFTLYTVSPNSPETEPFEMLQECLTREPDIDCAQLVGEPSGGQWRSVGLSEVADGLHVYDLDGAGYLFKVRFNERILPANVRDEKLKAVVEKLTEQQGHKVNKKDYAQLREQVEFELLPKAFVRRSDVLVLLRPNNWLYAFTASPKRSSDAVSVVWNYLRQELDIQADFYPALVIGDPVSTLTNLCLAKRDDYTQFVPGAMAVFKGSGKRTIRVKDRDIDGDEVQALLKAGYQAHDLELVYYRNGGGNDTPTLYFKMNDKLAFRGIAFDDTVLNSNLDRGDDGKVAWYSFAWLVAAQYEQLATDVIALFGGLRDFQKDAGSETTSTTPANDEDDEL